MYSGPRFAESDYGMAFTPEGRVRGGRLWRLVLHRVLVATLLIHPMATAQPAEYGTGTVSIPLDAGLNLIAISVTPLDTNAASVFASLGSALREASAYDAATDTWQSYAPSAPSFLNTLDVVAPGQAFVLLMDAAATLVISGEPLDSAEYQLESGWNFIGDNGLALRPPEDVFGEVGDGLKGVFTFDGIGWPSYFPGAARGPESITEMNPGSGFWIIINTPVEWYFDSVVFHLLRVRADLFVEDIRTSEDTFGGALENEGFFLRALVKNQGYQPALNVVTKFYKKPLGSNDFEFIGQDSSATLTVGSNRIHEISVPGGFLYQTVAKAVIDEGEPAGVVPELNERNNRRTEQIHVRMPDPALEAFVSLSPEVPYTDSMVTMSTDVTNSGDADADGFVVRFRFEDFAENTLWSDDITFGPGGESVLVAGETRTYDRTFNLASYTSGPGDYRFAVLIDPDLLLKESDEHNNQILLTQYLMDPPALTIEQPNYCCWYSPNGPKVGDDVRVSVTIRNEGASTATNIEVTYDNTSDAGGGQWQQGNQTIIPDIVSGSLDHTHDTLENVAEGTHAIQVTVEYTDENPSRTEQFTLPDLVVRGLLPDIWPTNIQIDQAYPNVGSDPQFTVDIYNSNEETDAGAFDVDLYYTQADPWTDQDLNLIGSASVSSGIPRGLATSVTVTWNSPPAGDFIVVAWADATNSLAEVWDNNNQHARRGVFIRGSGADLMPTQVWSEPRNPIVNQESQLKAFVVNAGDAQATFDTTFYRQEGATRTEIATSSGTTLGSGEMTEVSVSWTPTEEGTYSIVAVVDPGDLVTESLEGNNEFARNINVRPQPYSIVFTDDWIVKDKSQTENAASVVGNHGKAWCYADVREGCHWDTWFGIPYYNCDWQDRSAVRVARYKTFRVDGPAGHATLADISADLQILGIIDSFYHPLTGSAYWSIKSVAGLFRGPVDGSASYNLNYPMRYTDPPLIKADSGSLWSQIAGGGASTLAGQLCGVQCAPLQIAAIALDSFTADVLVFEKGTLEMSNVTLQTGQEYTVFVYVDLVTAVVGAGAFCYADFFYHSPHNDPQAKEFLKDRGVWLYNVDVDFK